MMFGKRDVKPAKAAKEKRRVQAIAVRSFAAAQTDRLLANWRWDGGFSAQEIRTQLASMRSRSRELAKNNPNYKRFLQLFCINVVGEGFALKSTPHDGVPGLDSFRLDAQASAFIQYHFWRWSTWRDLKTNRTWADATGRKTLSEIDQLNAKTWARDGEYFIIPVADDNPYGISLRIVRPDACDETYFMEASAGQNPVYCGVEIDKNFGFPVAYYFKTLNPQSQYRGRFGPLVRIPASRVIHGFTPEDEDQPRGVPIGHSSMVKLKMLEEYDKAEITAARDEACSVRTYHAPKDDDAENFIDLTSPEYSAIANALVAEKEPGQAEILPHGYQQTINTPQHPNRELTAFKASMLKDIASGLGTEYSVFANDWSGVSFSSVRLGTIAERDMWKMLQSQMIAQSKTPVFIAWLKSFLSSPISGQFPYEKLEKFAEHEFKGRRWMWVDPMKDMNAAKLAVDNYWKTNSDVADDLGSDYDDNLEGVKREKDSREKKGLTEPAYKNGMQAAIPAESEAKNGKEV